jgi:hypothetical protein
MTQPPPSRPPADRQFARDVAKQLDRRQVRRRLTLWSTLLAMVAAGALYLRCGHGLGLGGGGDGGGGEPGPRPVAAPPRCAIQVSADGISIDGRATTPDQAVAACKAAPGIDVLPTGDARHGDVEELRAALEAAGGKAIVVHPPPRASQTPGDPRRN